MSSINEAAAFVEIRSGDGTRVTRRLSKSSTIGRAVTSEIHIDHPSVSRRHAELAPDSEGRWIIRDLKSHNGTFVNGAAVGERVLRHGDRIAIGQVVLHFSHDQPQGTTVGEDAPGYTIQSLDQTRAARVSGAHVAAILGFGRGLQETQASSQRTKQLLELAVTPELGGWWAYALRISVSGEKLEMQSLSEPASSPTGKTRTPHLSRSVLGAVHQAREPLFANNLTRMLDFQAELTRSPDIERFSAVACPLAGSEQYVDVLYVILPPELGNVEWLMLISLAVEQYRHAESTWAARAAADARRILDHEMEVAREVQARTLPNRGSESSLDWAVRFDPCRSVGGDYVDVIARDDGTFLLLVADTVGKGLQAALIASGLHAIFHTNAGSPPNVSIAAADRYLRTFLPDSSFVTFAALAFDPRTGKGTSFNCGHPPFLAVSAGGARALDGGDNLPLGMCDGQVESTPVSIDFGEWIVGYTDGLTELRNGKDDMLGSSALRDLFQRECFPAQTCSAEAVAARIFECLDEFRGTRLASDDRTLFLARRSVEK